MLNVLIYQATLTVVVAIAEWYYQIKMDRANFAGFITVVTYLALIDDKLDKLGEKR